jgi:hypothetical protein
MSDFKTTAEIWQWLLDGGKLYDNENKFHVLELKNGFIHLGAFRHDMYFSDPNRWSKHIEPEWYEETPLRRLCHVWDISEKMKDIAVVVAKDQSTGYFECLNKRYFKNAEPLTDDEIRSFLQDSE